MNFSKLNNELVLLFDKPIVDDPLFTANVPNKLLALLGILIGKEFSVRSKYVKYEVDKENKIIFLVVRNEDENYFVVDSILYSGEKYTIVIFSNAVYDMQIEKLVEFITITSMLTAFTVWRTEDLKKDYQSVDIVNFFTPAVIALATVGMKFTVNEQMERKIFDKINQAYGIKFKDEWLHGLIDDIESDGVCALLDYSLVAKQKNIDIYLEIESMGDKDAK